MRFPLPYDRIKNSTKVGRGEDEIVSLAFEGRRRLEVKSPVPLSRRARQPYAVLLNHIAVSFPPPLTSFSSTYILIVETEGCLSSPDSFRVPGGANLEVSFSIIALIEPPCTKSRTATHESSYRMGVFELLFRLPRQLQEKHLRIPVLAASAQ